MTDPQNTTESDRSRDERSLLDALSSVASDSKKNVVKSNINIKQAPNFDAEMRQAEVKGKDLENEGKKQDNELKKTYGFWLLIILGAQLLIMNFTFISVGFSWLNYNEWALHLYVSGTLAEVFALVFIVTKYLFPNNKN